jgi:predicted membrane-bound spermidine synthase
MELVWYRMLSPLLGGSSYTFGLILAVALLGIGAGGLAYTLRGAERPATLSAFAITCALEALFLAVPFAAGDRIAWLALFLRSMGSVGLVGHVMAWSLVTSLVVLPAAMVSGYQFPLLIALLGRGGRRLGQHVALAYAYNTAGAIVGSLAGGFVLLPLFGALGMWKLTVWVLLAMSAAAVFLQLRAGLSQARAVLPSAAAVLALALIYGSSGPTGFWRHTPIGAGRLDGHAVKATRNRLKELARDSNASVSWEADGRESTVALSTRDDTAFLVNGKSDGAAITDAGTQVMGGLLGALLHPGTVKRALVVGLGTGSTAGWLGQLPGIERVDVVELEPAILHVARVCTPVNKNVLANPKVRMIIGDAREVLLTSRDKYDLIFSEPSNPYRAGIASLFTLEFYRAVRERLERGGVFVQWLQAYEIDARSVRTVYTTLASTFPSVESWRTRDNDVVLISREAAVPLDVDAMSARIAIEPFREALLAAWRAQTVADVLAHFVARPSFAAAIARAEGEHRVNTDDLNLLEFSVARALGRPDDFSADRLLLSAHQRGEARPIFAGNAERRVDWPRVYDSMISMHMLRDGPPLAPPMVDVSDDMDHRFQAQKAWYDGRIPSAIREWESQPKPPESPIAIMAMADAYAATGNRAKAAPLMLRLRELEATEADAIEAKLSFTEGKLDAAWQSLERALVAYRTDPWASQLLMRRAMMLTLDLVDAKRTLYAAVEATLRHDFVASSLRFDRLDVLLELTLRFGKGECVDAIAAYGPHYPWRESALRKRVQCYATQGHAALASAQAELDEFLNDGGVDFAAEIKPDRPIPNIKVAPSPSSSAVIPLDRP